MPHKALTHAPPGSHFSEIIDEFARSVQTDPFRTWLILPTNRLIRTAKHRFISAKIPFTPDHICTLDQFCEYLLDRYGGKTTLIREPQARILLSDLIHAQKNEIPLFFTQKTPASRTLLELQTLISVINRREIAYPDCLSDLQTEKSRQITLILNSYLEKLKTGDLVDKDTLLSWTIKLFSESSSVPVSSFLTSCYFYGLFEPLPLEKRLIQTIADSAAEAHYIIPSGKDPETFADTGAWISPDIIESKNKTGDPMSLTAFFAHDADGRNLADINRIRYAGFRDPSCEMREIAREIGRLRERNIPYHDITVAFSDIRTALSYAEEILPDFSIPWHTSSAPLLIHAPVISFLMQILESAERGFRYEDIIRIVQSPYLSFRWIRDSDPGLLGEEPGKSGEMGEILSYSALDIICRTYGIDGGYIDWEKQFDRIVWLIEEGEETGEKKESDGKAFHQAYIPKRPLPKETILITIEGCRELLRRCRVLGEKRTLREHITVYKDLLDSIGAPVPERDPSRFVSNSRLNEEELRALSLFYEILEELGDIERFESGEGGIMRPSSYGRFLNGLRLLLQDRSSDPDTEEKGILLTGIREMVHQQVPYLFLGSLNEGLIPRLTTRLPFTNATESRRMETRSIGDILRQERYQFIAALMAGTEQVYLSHYLHKDDRTALSSSFIDHLTTRYDPLSWGDACDEPDLEWFRYAESEAGFEAGKAIEEGRWEDAVSLLDADETVSGVLERIKIERNYRFRLNRSEYDGIIGSSPDGRRLSEKFGPGFVWSASMLESYASCPFRFYLERVAGIRPLPDLGSDPGAGARGTLIHTILYRFGRLMHESDRFPITPELLPDAVEAIHAIATDELENVPYQTRIWHAKKRQLLGGADLGTGIFEQFVKTEFCRLSPDESGRIPKPFIPSSFEFSFGAGAQDETTESYPKTEKEPVDLAEIAREWAECGDDSADGDREAVDDVSGSDIAHTANIPEKILFSGRIDRIDITPDGLFGVVDYKTGMKVPSNTEITRMKALQLPLYLHAFRKISGKTPVFGSYCHIQRTVTHSISIFDPDHSMYLPQGKKPRTNPDWKKLMNDVLKETCSHVSAIQRGEFPIHAGAECKKDWYCPYQTICRFQPDRGSSLDIWYHYPEEEPVCPGCNPDAGGEA